MDYKELQDILSTLEYTSYKLEETYVENEGEVTPETEEMEAEIEALKFLLNGEGVDFLGRWLKSKEDKMKSLKAEKDYLSRQIESVGKSIDFIKEQIRRLMDATGCEKVKGEYGYAFATYTSTKTDVDKELLKEYFLPKVEEAVRDILPPDVSVSLSASVNKVEEGAELPNYYTRTETPTIRFTKPRAKKED